MLPQEGESGLNKNWAREQVQTQIQGTPSIQKVQKGQAQILPKPNLVAKRMMISKGLVTLRFLFLADQLHVNGGLVPLEAI